MDRLRGSSQSTCQGREWVPDIPFCEPLDPDNKLSKPSNLLNNYIVIFYFYANLHL